MDHVSKRFTETIVGDVYDLIVKRPSTVKSSAKIRDAIEEMLQNPVSRKVYVVDDDGKLIGTVTTETILRLLGYRVGVRESGAISFYRFLRDALKEDVMSVMQKSTAVKKETKLTEVLQLMIENHLNDLPVIDDQGRLIGEVISLELFIIGKGVFEGSISSDS
ncbi:MAG: CBS domain-containing protein [Methanomassiliicoccales archaeon]|nr:CBS domain-containing protein [Methanomassiliicoccales archaeon]